jgi:hypothetical protein
VLQIHPNISLPVACPVCQTDLAIRQLHFAGIPIFAQCDCTACGETYLLDLPVGHSRLHPAIIQTKTEAVFHDGLPWYGRSLLNIVRTRGSPRRPNLRVRRRPRTSNSAVIVNCLDTRYGHSLLKLLSSLQYVSGEDSHHDAVVIIPAKLSWLVPSRVHGLIEVDLDWPNMGSWLSELDGVVKDILSTYEAAFVAEAISQPNLRLSDLSLLGPQFNRKPFWQDRAKQGARRVTMIIREDDRLWIGWERLVRAIRRRPFLSRIGLSKLLVLYQNAKFASVAKILTTRMPELQISVVGIGRTGRFPDYVIDLRKASMTEPDELAWCAEYTRSDVVIGVHGSNMLIPSALSGAVVEFLPLTKLRNITQDLITGDTQEAKLCLFRYRILSIMTGPAYVAATVMSILKDADMHHLNIIENRACSSAWLRPLKWKKLPGGF